MRTLRLSGEAAEVYRRLSNLMTVTAFVSEGRASQWEARTPPSDPDYSPRWSGRSLHDELLLDLDHLTARLERKVTLALRTIAASRR